MSFASQKFHNLFRRGETALHELSYIFWECTLRCNLNCAHCGSDCRADAITPDMPVDDFLRAIAPYATQKRRPLIVVTGGEPLMRGDIVECGEKFHKAGFRWSMVTNGMAYTEELHRRLRKTGFVTATLSLDGPREEHNRLRGNALSYDRALRALDIMVADTLFRHDVVTCVNPSNLDHLEEMYQTLLDHGCKSWRFFTIAPIGRAAEDPSLMLSGEQLRRLMAFIERIRAEKRLNARFSCEAWIGQHELTARHWHFFCRAGINIASVLVDGSISACPNIDRRFAQGSIYTDDFQDVWENRFGVMRERSWMRCGICKGCSHWRDCGGGAMHLRTPDSDTMRCLYRKMYPKG